MAAVCGRTAELSEGQIKPRYRQVLPTVRDSKGEKMDQLNHRDGGRFQVDMDWRNAADALFSNLIIERAARAIISDRWNTLSASAPPCLPGTILLHHHHSFGPDEWLLEVPPLGIAFIARDEESVQVRVAADTDADGRQLLALVREAMPECHPAAGAARVTFWRRNRHGNADPVTKDLEAPSWVAIVSNYPAATERVFAPLLAEDWRPHSGRLLLWHGEPGTGKSYAVRALMQAWKTWCTFHVVLDPERFFGDSADYMMSVLLQQEDTDEKPANGNGGPPPWRLLIVEDTGELLAIDAKDRQGQGLSRLLNVCDGLLGQSLNVMVLITTNEDLGRLHPAVTRPGRCLANVEFQRFDTGAAQRWCAAQGVANLAPAVGRPTLADLYALLDGRVVAHQPAVAGFLTG